MLLLGTSVSCASLPTMVLPSAPASQQHQLLGLVQALNSGFAHQLVDGGIRFATRLVKDLAQLLPLLPLLGTSSLYCWSMGMRMLLVWIVLLLLC